MKVNEANAQGIKFLVEAGADQAVLTLKSLEALETLANGNSTKIIVPSDLQGIATLATTFKEVVATDKTEKKSK